MRNLLIVLVAILVSCCTSPKHLEFEGIEMTGSTDSFADSLMNHGYVKMNDAAAHCRTMYGTFADHEGCLVFLLGTSNTNTIYHISVSSNREYQSWDSVKSDYNKFKSYLVSMYGKPSADDFSFLTPYKDGDGNEMTAVKEKKLHAWASWTLKTGEIMLFVGESGEIYVSYDDHINSKLAKKEKSDK